MDVQTAFDNFLVSSIEFLPKLITAIVILVATWIISGLASRWSQRVFEHQPKADKTVVALLGKIIHAVVLIFGVLLALQQMDVNVTGFLAGLGIVGIAVGFALQDIGRNFVAGVIMLLYRPFSIGDSVMVANTTGEVMDITLRDTVIKNWDGEKVILPNSNVFNGAIVNYSNLALRRRTITVVVSPNEEIGRISALFQEAIAAVPGVQSEPGVVVRLVSIGDSGPVLSIQFWVDQTIANLLQTHSDAIQALQQAAMTANISIPSPVQSVYIENPS